MRAQNGEQFARLARAVWPSASRGFRTNRSAGNVESATRDGRSQPRVSTEEPKRRGYWGQVAWDDTIAWLGPVRL